MIENMLEERQAIHGDAEVNFAITGRIWGAMLCIDDIPAWQVALMMDAFKSVRCIANPHHEDNWDDKLGYTKHGGEIAARLEN
jgi:hypothetical protein